MTRDEAEHIAKLAKLQLSEDEIETFRKQLSEVLEYIKKLNEVDTSGIDPTNQVTGLRDVFRKDRVEEPLPQEKALTNAKKTQNGYFMTKAIFEET